MVTVQNPVLVSALRYIELGYKVFPCGGASGKEPRTPHGWQDATLSVKQAEAWFGGRTPPNIAIATTGLCVVDIDPVPGAAEGLVNPWPVDPDHQLDLGLAPSAVTPRGGRHYFFADPEQKVRNSASVLAEYVDVRAAGGYVLVAPSSNSHGDYRWQSPLEVPSKDLDPTPGWIIESLEKARHGGKQRLSDQDWLDLCGGVGEGRRNDAMARLVGKWISMDYDPAETLALAVSVNAQNNPPLPMEEVKKIVMSVHTTHLRSKERQEDPEVTKALDTLRDKGFEPPASFVAKVEKAAAKKAEETVAAQQAEDISSMDSQQATDFLAQEFSWLPEPLTKVEQTVSRAGFEQYWIVLASGRRIVLGAVAAVLSPAKINEVMAVEFRRQIPMRLRKKGAWSPVADAILRAAVVLDPDFTPEREIQEWLQDYCSDVRRGSEWERLHKSGLPYVHEGELRVQAYRFASWLKTTRDVMTSRFAICDLLRKIGMTLRTLYAPDPDEAGTTVCRSYCCGPWDELCGPLSQRRKSEKKI